MSGEYSSFAASRSVICHSTPKKGATGPRNHWLKSGLPPVPIIRRGRGPKGLPIAPEEPSLPQPSPPLSLSLVVTVLVATRYSAL